MASASRTNGRSWASPRRAWETGWGSPASPSTNGESDTALPEIDKLIALSRLFGVSVGWLLGVEESPSPEADPSGELTEQQLHMVEELVRRYSGIRGLSPHRRKVLKLAVAAGAVCLAGVLYSLFSQLGRLDQQYTDLQNSIYRVESSVDGQIGSISSRVEEILKAQNSLVTDAGVELKLVSLSDGDPGAAVFSAYAVPRTYQEGMTAEFHIENGTGGVQTVPGVLHPDGRTFRVDSLSCALTDDIRVSVVFIAPDGTRSTQLLDQFDGLYGGTLPSARVRGILPRKPAGPGGQFQRAADPAGALGHRIRLLFPHCLREPDPPAGRGGDGAGWPLQEQGSGHLAGACGKSRRASTEISRERTSTTCRGDSRSP